MLTKLIIILLAILSNLVWADTPILGSGSLDAGSSTQGFSYSFIRSKPGIGFFGWEHEYDLEINNYGGYQKAKMSFMVKRAPGCKNAYIVKIGSAESFLKRKGLNAQMYKIASQILKNFGEVVEVQTEYTQTNGKEFTAVVKSLGGDLTNPQVLQEAASLTPGGKNLLRVFPNLTEINVSVDPNLVEGEYSRPYVTFKAAVADGNPCTSKCSLQQIAKSIRSGAVNTVTRAVGPVQMVDAIIQADPMLELSHSIGLDTTIEARKATPEGGWEPVTWNPLSWGKRLLQYFSMPTVYYRDPFI